MRSNFAFIFVGFRQARELGVEVFHAGTAMQGDKVVTDGGRVLTVTAIKEDLMSALEEANKGVAAIWFKGAIFRKDIGYRAIAFLQRSVYVSKGTSRNRCLPSPQPFILF